MKVPRFAFEKFPEADTRLTTTMKSVGEAMAIGRSFPEALQKALRSLEKVGASFKWRTEDLPELLGKIGTPTEFRLQQVQSALFNGASVDEVYEITRIDPWFLEQIKLINDQASLIANSGELTRELLKSSKMMGFSDA